MTLTFEVNPDLIMVHPSTKLRDPEANGLALRVKKLKETLKETWKEINLVKIYRPVLAHWPNNYGAVVKILQNELCL